MAGSHPRKQKKHYGPIAYKVDGRDIIDCEICKFKHANPIPTGKEIKNFYSTFYITEKPDYFVNAEEDLDWWNQAYKNYYHLLEKYSQGRRLLDIGSGPGYFLKVGQEMGWDVMGFEPSAQACQYSSKLGVNVINDYFNFEKASKMGRFDVVCLSLVLEHLPDPVKLVEEVKKILNKNGLIFIMSPNEFNPLQISLLTSTQPNPWWIVPLEHINYFDFESIRKLLQKLNFKVVDALATYPMEIFALSGENYIENDKVGRACHEKRKTFEINLYRDNPDLLNNLYRDFATQGVGRNFITIGRKNGA